MPVHNEVDHVFNSKMKPRLCFEIFFRGQMMAWGDWRRENNSHGVLQWAEQEGKEETRRQNTSDWVINQDFDRKKKINPENIYVFMYYKMEIEIFW